MTAHFLGVPLEIRRHIYSYLIPAEVVTHPIPSVGITSVSHEPPCSDLLCIHPQVSQELQEYFFSIASWKLVFSHAFNFFRVDPALSNLASWRLLDKVQTVEVVFFCDILLLKEYPSFGLQNFCAEIKRRASRACEVLLTAKGLRHVTVSWIDTTDTGAWDEKAKVVEPLQILRTKVNFSIGQVIGPEDSDATIFLDAIVTRLGARRDCHTITSRFPQAVRTELPWASFTTALHA